MAESKDKNPPKAGNSFADDLDSMLNLDETSDEQVDRLIDDDDAIDRLLMPDTFDEEEQKAGEQNDIDKLIADGVEQGGEAADDFDEFGDDADYFIPDFQLKPDALAAAEKRGKALFDEPEDDVDSAEEHADEVIDAFSDEMPVNPDVETEPLVMEDDELDQMTEIDELDVEESEPPKSDDADFLLADFDISADELEDHADDQSENSEPTIVSESTDDETPAAGEIDEDELVADSNATTHEELQDISSELDDVEPQASGLVAETGLKRLQSELDEKLAALNTQLSGVKKQQNLLRQQMQQKGNQDEVVECQENLDALKTEQRKVKRNLDTLLGQKPVSAYVANGIAILALIIGGGLGFQGYVAKRQLAQVADYLAKLQEQVNAAPTADAAEKEMLRNQLDALGVSNSTTANQVAELTKLITGDDDDGAPGGLKQRFDKLNNQDMQMGAAIESLQSKVAALEKGKRSATAKPAVTKKPVVKENWAVNLVAYKQDWYAKRKAEEFAGKGVPAKVNKVLTKGETWYRLAVDGFSSQYEAAAYAARVKKTLNLDSVWVAKIK